MFNDLDATLAAVLDASAAPADLRAADVSFDTPDRDYKPTQTTVNLFLHQVVENRTLRDDARVIAPTANGYTSRLPSLRVDCTYLVTAWSAQTGGVKAAEEHRLLGLALQWLSRFPVVDEGFLRGSLTTPPQPFPVSTTVARAEEGRSNSEFWTALGVPPRPAFPVTVTITVEPYDEVEEFAAVQALRVGSTQVGHPVLGGWVLDHALVPVAAAAVAVVETGIQTTSAATGEFAFPGLDFGAYTLRVRPAGQPAEQAAVTYAETHQLHTVVLSAP